VPHAGSTLTRDLARCPYCRGGRPAVPHAGPTPPRDLAPCPTLAPLQQGTWRIALIVGVGWPAVPHAGPIPQRAAAPAGRDLAHFPHHREERPAAPHTGPTPPRATAPAGRDPAHCPCHRGERPTVPHTRPNAVPHVRSKTKRRVKQDQTACPTCASFFLFAPCSARSHGAVRRVPHEATAAACHTEH
jgi:hypothetical protein